MRALLVVTECGFAKRIPVASIPKTRRGRPGARVSAVPVAAAIVVYGTNADVILATAEGKVQVIDLAEIPTRTRAKRKAASSKGVRVMTLDPGDRVAAVAVHVREEQPEASREARSRLHRSKTHLRLRGPQTPPQLRLSMTSAARPRTPAAATPPTTPILKSPSLGTPSTSAAARPCAMPNVGAPWPRPRRRPYR